MLADGSYEKVRSATARLKWPYGAFTCYKNALLPDLGSGKCWYGVYANAYRDSTGIQDERYDLKQSSNKEECRKIP